MYILMRCVGKYFGARLSAKAMKCEKKVVDYLGVTLFPQAGVALGMVVSAQALGPAHGSIIRNIILFSVLVYELVGPMLTRIALQAQVRSRPVQAMPGNRASFEKRPKITKGAEEHQD